MARQKDRTVSGLRNANTARPTVDDSDVQIPAEVMDEEHAKRQARRKSTGRGEVVVYQSKFRNFMTTVEINDDVQINGRIARGHNRHIRFENYYFRTDDPKTIEWIESQDFYGLGRSVWREADLNAITLAIDAKRAIANLRAFGEDLDSLRTHMSAEDFDALEAVAGRLEKQREALEPTA